MTRHLLAIDGRDGSGKSHLSRALVAAAGDGVALVRVDDFRRPVDWQRSPDPGRAYYEDYYDFAALDQVLGGFLAGQDRAPLRVFDPTTETLAGDGELAFEGVDLVIVEGVMVRRVPRLADAIRVYLRTDEDEARRRILARDMARGRSRADVEARIDTRYFPAQRRYHQEYDPERTASVVVDHQILGAPAVISSALGAAPARVAAVLQAALPEFAR